MIKVFKQTPEWIKKRVAHRIGKPLSEETRKKQSESRKLLNLKGKNNPQWSRIEKQCLFCHSKFFVKKSHSDTKFCSRKCYGANRKGKTKYEIFKNPEEWTKKRITSLTGQKRPKTSETLKKLGHKPPSQLGKKFTKEHRRNMSLAQGGTGIPLKKYSHLRDKRYLNWRSDIFQRDNWICQTCGKRGGILHPHHIKQWAKFSELRYKIDNGITLCKECHILVHRKR
jgi:hypothetical protein